MCGQMEPSQKQKRHGILALMWEAIDTKGRGLTHEKLDEYLNLALKDRKPVKVPEKDLKLSLVPHHALDPQTGQQIKVTRGALEDTLVLTGNLSHNECRWDVRESDCMCSA